MVGMTSIHQLLPKVMASVGFVEKKRQTQGSGSFRFRGIEDVLAKVQPALTEHGVTIVPASTEIVADTSYTTAKGTAMRNVQVRTTFRAYGPEGDYVEFQALGEGADAGDKATAKAQSIAQKYALFQAFSIPTEDDPDASTHERAATQQPVDWFKANGWRDQEQHDAFMAEAKRRLHDLPEAWRAKGVEAWKMNHGSWPLTDHDAGMWEASLSQLERQAKDGELPGAGDSGGEEPAPDQTQGELVPRA